MTKHCVVKFRLFPNQNNLKLTNKNESNGDLVKLDVSCMLPKHKHTQSQYQCPVVSDILDVKQQF